MTVFFRSLAVLLVAAVFAVVPRACAQESKFHADVETDVLAFVLRGYSLHTGLGYDRIRVDLGAFAMALPDFVHGNDGFDASFDGFGVKVQYFLFAAQSGAFVGVDAGLSRMLIEREGTDLAKRRTEFGVGVNLGWRIDLPASFYVTPWVGLGYTFASRDTVLDGQRFDASPWSVFPAIHVGYKPR